MADFRKRMELFQQNKKDILKREIAETAKRVAAANERIEKNEVKS